MVAEITYNLPNSFKLGEPSKYKTQPTPKSTVAWLNAMCS